MDKKARNNKFHLQGEMKLSPEEIRALRYFLKGYMMGFENSQKETKPSSKGNNYPETIIIAVACSLLFNLIIVPLIKFIIN